jgi:hypothetical protein
MEENKRKLVRHAIAALLAPLAGDGDEPFVAVYKGRKNDFMGASPVCCVVSTGSRPDIRSHAGFTDTHYLEVINFVAFATDGEPEDYELVEDQLDELYAAIVETLIPHAGKTDNWKALRFDDRSEITDIELGGKKYWLESIPVRVEMI